MKSLLLVFVSVTSVFGLQSSGYCRNNDTTDNNKFIELLNDKRPCINGIYFNNTCHCYKKFGGIKCQNTLECIKGEMRYCSSITLNFTYQYCRCFDFMIDWYGDFCDKPKCYNGYFDNEKNKCICTGKFTGNYCNKHPDEPWSVSQIVLIILAIIVGIISCAIYSCIVFFAVYALKLIWAIGRR